MPRHAVIIVLLTACKPAPDVLGRVAGPRIYQVDGAGTTDLALGHSPHHFQDRIVVQGERLAQVEAWLRTAAGTERVLAPMEAGDDARRVYRLPRNLATGEHVLRVANAAGEDEAKLYILQGEPGDLSELGGAQIVGLINAAMDVDPSVALRGMLHGDVSTLALIGGPEGPAIVVRGQEIELLGSGTVALALFDLTTHTVVQTPAPRLFNNAADLDAALANVGEGRAVLVVSSGAAMLQQANVMTRLMALGAGGKLAGAAARPYAMIGHGSAGLEALGDLGGTVALSTAVLDRSVIGMAQSAVGELVDGKWCTALQGVISCTADAPQPGVTPLSKQDVLDIVSDAGVASGLGADDVLGIVAGAGYIKSDALVGLKVTESDVETYVTNGALNLAAGTTVAGKPIVTKENDPSVNALGKAQLACSAGQVAKWSGASWGCADDADTSMQDADVEALIETGFGTGMIATEATVAAQGTVWSDSYLSVGKNAAGGARAWMRASDGHITTEGDIEASGNVWAKNYVSAGENTAGAAKAYLSGADGLIHTDGNIDALGNMWSKAFVSVGTSTQGTALAYLRGSDGLIHTDGAVEAVGNVWSSSYLSVGKNTQGGTKAYLRGSDGLIHTDGDMNAMGNIWSNGFISAGSDGQGGVKAYLRGSDGFLYTKGSANVQGSLGVGVASAMYALDVGGAMQVRGGMIYLRPIDAGGKCVVLWNQNGTLQTSNNQQCPAIP